MSAAQHKTGSSSIAGTKCPSPSVPGGTAGVEVALPQGPVASPYLPENRPGSMPMPAGSCSAQHACAMTGLIALSL